MTEYYSSLYGEIVTIIKTHYSNGLEILTSDKGILFTSYELVDLDEARKRGYIS